MAIFKAPTVSNLGTRRYFSTKDVGRSVFKVGRFASDLDFCTCLLQCVPKLKQFTDEIGTDFYKNDLFPIFINQILGGTVVATLTKNGGTPIVLTDNTYGTYADNIFLGYFRFELSFFKTWQNSGYGNYVLKVENFNSSGTLVQESTSPEFTLMKYSDVMANGTVRIETSQGGEIKNGIKYNAASAAMFRQQLRLPGALVYSGERTENSQLQLNTDERNSIQVKDQIFPEYEFQVDLVSAKQIVTLIGDYLLANMVFISDYNIMNWPYDPANMNANRMQSIPLLKTASDFTASRSMIRKSFKFSMEYAFKNIYKTNN